MVLSRLFTLIVLLITVGVIGVSVWFSNSNIFVREDYVVEVSESYDGVSEVPLVFVLHGSGGNAEEFKFVSGWDKLQGKHDFVAVYLNGAGSDWNGGGCCGDTELVDDVGYVRGVFEEIVLKYNIDLSRVFVAGFSSGGIMAYRLGCELSDIVTGIGVGSGSLEVECLNERPVSLFHVHGVNDSVVPAGGGYASVDDMVFRSALDSVNIFGNVSDCETSSVLTTGVGRVSSWDNCRNGVGVRFVENEGEHAWFINNAELMWDFLYAHPRV